MVLFGCCKDKIVNNNTIIHTTNTEFIHTDHVLKSTVSLVMKVENNKNQLFCGGVFISPTIILTARHCILDEVSILKYRYLLGEEVFQTMILPQVKQVIANQEIEYTTYDSFSNNQSDFRNSLKTYKAKLMYITYDDLLDQNSMKINDLALLKVEQENASNNWLNISSNDNKVSNTVFSVGMPKGEPWIFSKGMIAQKKFFREKHAFDYVNIFIAPGSSGGPLVNSSGELVGIAHSMFSPPGVGHSGLSLYISTNKLREYLNLSKRFK